MNKKADRTRHDCMDAGRLQGWRR